MAEPKDIGKAFKEKLRDFDRSPSSISWEDIESKLQKKEVKLIPNWVKISSVLTLLFLISYITFETIKKTEKPNNTITNIREKNCFEPLKEGKENALSITNTNEVHDIENDKKKLKTSLGNSISSFSKTNIKLLNKNNKNSHLLKTGISSNKNKKGDKSSQNKSNPRNKNVATTKEKKSNTKIIDSKALGNSINTPIPFSQNEKKHDNHKNINPKDTVNTEALLKTPNEELKSTKKEKDTLIFILPLKNKNYDTFSIGVHITPTRLITTQGSLINDRFEDYTNRGRITINYGVLIKNHFSEKIALRLGLNLLKTSNNTKDISTSQLPASIISQWAEQTSVETIEKSSKVDLLQRLNYIESIIGLQYQLSNKRIATSIVGGFNINFLNKNKIIVKTPNGDTKINGISNIKKIALGFHIGANLQYKLTNKIFLNIDPLINHQFSEASFNSKSFNLLYFTIQTGIHYKFE